MGRPTFGILNISALENAGHGCFSYSEYRSRFAAEGGTFTDYYGPAKLYRGRAAFHHWAESPSERGYKIRMPAAKAWLQTA